MAVEQEDLATNPGIQHPWRTHGRALGLAGFGFILLQSICTAVMTLSGLRFVIGVGALAAAAGLARAATSCHADRIRIPMMLLAVVGSLVNLYVVWRIRSLRARSSSQWRMRPATTGERRSESIQIWLALGTLALVAMEAVLHRILHGAG
jgi:hypothetical protein